MQSLLRRLNSDCVVCLALQVTANRQSDDMDVDSAAWTNAAPLPRPASQQTATAAAAAAATSKQPAAPAGGEAASQPPAASKARASEQACRGVWRRALAAVSEWEHQAPTEKQVQLLQHDAQLAKDKAGKVWGSDKSTWPVVAGWMADAVRAAVNTARASQVCTALSFIQRSSGLGMHVRILQSRHDHACH